MPESYPQLAGFTAPSLPTRMQAIGIREPGGPEVLECIEIECPQPAADEVLIKVAAAGVNRPDCLQRRGLYPAPPGTSPLPGLEVAGVVVATGALVEHLRPGNLVCALLAGGGYAEYCTVPAVQCLPIPAGMSLQATAALPETFFTVWTNVFELGRLQAGERLLVHGGASGIGTTAIQLASAMGAKVFATAGSPAKVGLCEALGACKAIDYHTSDFLTALQPLTDNQGMDVIFDIVGGSYLEQNIKLLADNGRLVVIGILGGAKGTLNLGLVLAKRLTVTGSTLRSRTPAAKGAIARALRQHAWPLLASGRIKPVVQEFLPLRDAARAHTMLEANTVAGKLVLIVDPLLATEIAHSDSNE